VATTQAILDGSSTTFRTRFNLISCSWTLTASQGLDFVRVLEEQVSKCDVFLAVIGRGWLDARDEPANAGSTL
jgi:hypothetical protein